MNRVDNRSLVIVVVDLHLLVGLKVVKMGKYEITMRLRIAAARLLTELNSSVRNPMQRKRIGECLKNTLNVERILLRVGKSSPS